MKKSLLLLAFVYAFCITTISATAHSTIYVDDIGRLHFLGKDPGSKANYTQQIGNFDNPEQKDLTNIIYKNPELNTKTEKQANLEKEEKTYSYNNKPNKSQGTYSDTKGAMDASNPYTYGNTNFERGVNDTKTIYTDDLGRQHFFRKENLTN